MAVPLSRRTLLKAGGGAALGLAAGAGRLPAWARPAARAAWQLGPGALPFPNLAEGTPTTPHIEHIVVLMMENHSFDNLLGMLPRRYRSRRKVDGLPVDARGMPTPVNRRGGKAYRAELAPAPCQIEHHPGQNWNASHISYAHGRNSGFVRASGPVAMWYWDRNTLPAMYSLAATFPIGQRFFCSTLCQTYPNRRFFFTGTASGTIATSTATFSIPAANGTIFDRLDRFGISWKDYYVDLPSPLIVPGVAESPERQAKFVSTTDFLADAAAGRLPQFSFVEPQYSYESQENPQDIQVGERFIARIARAVMHSPNWDRTALFITYDEHGGYYDHVPPPAAISPDDTPPLLNPGDIPGSYDRLGFRVPLIVVSPWAKRGYVSSVVQDLTSVLRFVERKWNLGAMTRRDANAADMTDYFDFRRPAFREPPRIAAAPPLGPGLEACRRAGLHPPTPANPNGDASAAAVRELRARARAAGLSAA
ncbi:MAG: phospholipase C [Solirubrobacteraceae bacterium]